MVPRLWHHGKHPMPLFGVPDEDIELLGSESLWSLNRCFVGSDEKGRSRYHDGVTPGLASRLQSCKLWELEDSMAGTLWFTLVLKNATGEDGTFWFSMKVKHLIGEDKNNNGPVDFALVSASWSQGMLIDVRSARLCAEFYPAQASTFLSLGAPLLGPTTKSQRIVVCRQCLPAPCLDSVTLFEKRVFRIRLDAM